MRIRILLLIFLLAIVLMNPAFSLGATIGWYFDSNASLRCTSASPYSTVTAYLCLSDLSPSSAVSGWELETEIVGQAYISSYALSGTALNTAVAPDFSVGISDSLGLAASSAGIVVLCSVNILPLDSAPISLYVKPRSLGTNPSAAVFTLLPDAGTLLTACTPYNNYSLPTAYINAVTWPCNAPLRSSRHTVLARTRPHEITIPSLLGADYIANVTFASSDLESILCAFNVDSVADYSLAGPDSTVIDVRASTGQYTSYDYRDVYRFTLADSSLTDSLSTVLAARSEILWSEPPISVSDEDRGVITTIEASKLHAAHSKAIFTDDAFSYDQLHFVNEQYPSYTLNVLPMWQVCTGSSAVTVGLIEQGVCNAHGDLDDGRVQGYTISDATGIGTEVAGIVGAETNNGLAIAGIAQNVQLLSENWTSGYTNDCSSRILDAVSSGADIINLSLGVNEFSGSEYATLANAVKTAYMANRVIVAGAGPYRTSGDNYPAAWPDVIAVGAFNSYLNNFGQTDPSQNIDLTAPYYRIRTTSMNSAGYWQNYTMIMSNYSFAPAMVSGAAALLLSYMPALYNDDVQSILKMSAYVSPSWSQPREYYGAGLVNIGAARDSLLLNDLIVTNDIGSTSYTIMNQSYFTSWDARNISTGASLAPGMYLGRPYLCFKDITYETTFRQVPHVWVRGVDTWGYRLGSTLRHWTNGWVIQDDVQHPITSTGCRVATYVYLIKTLEGQTVGFFPCAPEEIRWSIACLGKTPITAVNDGQSNDNASEVMKMDTWPGGAAGEYGVECTGGKEGTIEVMIYDIAGRKVAELYRGEYNGHYAGRWSGRRDDGRTAASAVYLAVARCAGMQVTRKIAVVR